MVTLELLFFQLLLLIINHIRFLPFLFSFNRSVQSSQNTLFPFCDFFHHGLYSLVMGALGPIRNSKTIKKSSKTEKLKKIRSKPKN